MCLILFAHRARPGLPLLVAANRDEFHGRPTAPASWWQDAPGTLAGRDLRGGGTWMGVARDGRWAALTNVRGGGAPADASAPSRGALVADYLRGDAPAADYLARVAAVRDRFDGFNLLVGDAEGVRHLGNRGDGDARLLPPGVYGLSNAPWGTPWPKTERGAAALRELMGGPEAPDDDALFRLLADAEPAPDDALPDTGIGRERERALSSLFIDTPGYGTRASTLLRMDDSGEVRLVERSWGGGVVVTGERSFRFARATASAPPSRWCRTG